MQTARYCKDTRVALNITKEYKEKINSITDLLILVRLLFAETIEAMLSTLQVKEAGGQRRRARKVIKEERKY